MLRPATEQFPEPEAELSLGLTPESAVDELHEHHGTAAFLVADAHNLPYGLRIVSDVDNAAKAELHGLPLFSADSAQRDVAIAMASDLAGLSHFLPVPPAQ
jgi:hypothetical protein